VIFIKWQTKDGLTVINDFDNYKKANEFIEHVLFGGNDSKYVDSWRADYQMFLHKKDGKLHPLPEDVAPELSDPNKNTKGENI